jgi:hypothetical protein
VFNTINGSTSDSATGGGDMIFAGGSTQDSNGYPAGYSFSDGTYAGFHSGHTSSTCAKTYYYTGGGDFLARGKTTGSIEGISTNCSIQLWANGGQIEMDGQSTNGSSHAIQIQRNADGTQSEIFSSSNASPAIKFTAISNGNYGFLSGYNLSSANRVLIQNTGTGGITINGRGGGQNLFDIGINGTSILSNGPINMTAPGSGWEGGFFTGALNSGLSNAKSYLGYCAAATCAGSRVASSSAQISITANRFASYDADVNLAVNTSGAFSFAPSDAAGFSQFKVSGQGLSFSQDCGGVTIGKDQTTNVYTAYNIDFYPEIKIVGPIRIYGNQLNIRSSLETTGSGNEIRIKTIARAYLHSGKSLKTAGGNVVIWTGAGKVAGTNIGGTNIYLDSTSSITTNGGKIWLAGGRDDGGGDASITTSRGKWDSVVAGDGLPDGYAVGYDDNNEWRIGIFLNTGAQLKSGGGDIFMAGAHGIAAYGDYGHMVFYPGTVVDSGTGRIAMWARSLTAITTQGIAFHWGNGGSPTIITSHAPSADAITIYSDSSLGSSWSRGIIAAWYADYSASRGYQGTQILATAPGGGITMTGIGSATATNDANGMYLDFADILAIDGPITLNGDSNNNQWAVGVSFGWINNLASSIRLGGWHAGPTGAVGGGTITTPGGVTANFTNSSADVTINTDSMYTREDSNGFYGVIFGTTGDVSILPANLSSGIVAAADSFEHAHNESSFRLGKLLFPVNPGSITIGRTNTATELTPNSSLSATGEVSVTGGVLTTPQSISAGTIRLNSTSGATTISAATTSGAGGTFVNASTAVAINGNSSSAGNITVSPLGAYTGSGTLTSSGTVTISGGTSVAPTAAIQATGNITLSGSGNITTASSSTATVTSNTGAVAITSTAGTISVERNVTAPSSITLTGDTLNLAANLNTTSSTGIVTIAPQTNSRVIDLGSEVSSRLSMTSAEVNRVSAGTLRIGASGGSNTGDINITAALAPTGIPTLALRTGSPGSVSSTGVRSITETNLAVQAGGTISLAASNVISGNLALNSSAATLTFNQSSGSFTPGTVDGISPEYGVPSSLTLSRVPTTATENRTLGQDFDPSPVATLRDEFGNSLTAANSQASNYSVTVTMPQAQELFPELSLGRQLLELPRSITFESSPRPEPTLLHLPPQLLLAKHS